MGDNSILTNRTLVTSGGATEYSPLHMRLLNCPGGTCPSMAMRLEMELEYAERRAKFIRKSQCQTRWSTEAPHSRHSTHHSHSATHPQDRCGSLLFHPMCASQTAPTGLRVVRGGDAASRSRACGGDAVSRCKRRITSMDAVSDDVSTCAGTGSLQSSVGSPLTSLAAPQSSETGHEILPLTRASPGARRRLQIVPKPRARAATARDKLCPPRREQTRARDAGLQQRRTLRDGVVFASPPSPSPCLRGAPPRDSRQRSESETASRAVLRVTRGLSPPARLRPSEPTAARLRALHTQGPPSLETETAAGLSRRETSVYAGGDAEPVPRRRRRLRRFKSCSSVQLFKNLMRRHARKLVHSVHGVSSEDFGSVETETETALGGPHSPLGSGISPMHSCERRSSACGFSPLRDRDGSHHARGDGDAVSHSPRSAAALIHTLPNFINTPSTLPHTLLYHRDYSDFDGRPLLVTDSDEDDDSEDSDIELDLIFDMNDY